MSQDITPYNWRVDPWDMHRDGVRFAQDQLDAWDMGHDTWMIPWQPYDASCDCGEGHGFRLPNKEGRMCVLTYPVPLVVMDALDYVDDLELDGAWPSIVGWRVDPESQYYGFEQEEPDVVALWDCWPLDVDQSSRLEDAMNLEYEGKDLWLIRRWAELSREHSDLPELIRGARKRVNRARKLGMDRTLRRELQLDKEAIAEWRLLGDLTELDQYGEPEFYVEDLQPDLSRDPDLAVIWNRLQASHRRARKHLKEIYPDVITRGVFGYRWS